MLSAKMRSSRVTFLPLSHKLAKQDGLSCRLRASPGSLRAHFFNLLQDISRAPPPPPPIDFRY